MSDIVVTYILGNQWNIRGDTIELICPKVEMDRLPTKRQVLKVNSELFDLLGLRDPVTVVVNTLYLIHLKILN